MTLGDFWGAGTAHPGLGDELGLSCLLVNDENGFALAKAAASSLELVTSSLAKCANESQPMLVHPPAQSEGRSSFWKAMREEGFESAASAAGVIGAFRSVKDICKKVMGKNGADVDYGKTTNLPALVSAADLAAMESERRYPYVFAAKNRSDSIREKSSSGGIFHALASAVIASGGVVYGCAFDERLSAAHIRCETMAEVERCMGSKYSQSRMGTAISDVRADLRAGRTVLFTGTPCQVDAVRKSCDGLGGGYS